MKRRAVLISSLAALPLGLATGCSRTASARAGGPPAVPVTVAESRLATVADRVDAVGSVEAYETVSVKAQRSHMNVTYVLPSEELTDEFVKTAARNGMIGLKGYRTVGGIRASIYNAMPVEGAQALASFMKDFASKKS